MLEVLYTLIMKKRVYAMKLAAQELFLASASAWLYCRHVEIQPQELAQNSYLNKKHLYSFDAHY